MYDICVARVEEKWTMVKCRLENWTFSNFEYARYAVDVTFQHSNRPNGTISEGMRYFSGKHKLYGPKVEVSVLPIGLAIGCTEHYPGSVSDLDIFRRNRPFHEEASKRGVRDLRYTDEGRLSKFMDDYWAILAEKGYQGAGEDLRVVHPVRTPARATLSLENVDFNRQVSSDGVIVENHFGRMCSSWTLLSHKWRWGEGLYEHVFKACLSLTNMSIRALPLRFEDGQHSSGVRNRLRAISTSQMPNRRRLHIESTQNRRDRMLKGTRRALFVNSDTE